MPAVEVFSAGIKFFKDHLFDHFKERIEHVRNGDIHWVLTVPAILNESARKFIRHSAEMVYRFLHCKY